MISQIGVVGRTGAGKHSMVAAILRLFEPQGVIRIDGIDTGTLSIKVRSHSVSHITLHLVPTVSVPSQFHIRRS